MNRRSVEIHGLADARRALAAGGPVELRTPPGAAGYLGPALFKAMIDEARAEFPDADMTAVLDCGDAPGTALSALRLGVEAVAVEAPAPVLQRLRAIAHRTGGRVIGTARDD